ncbi:ASCH domain-containing protein [Streptomyces misionensis]|uniref:ASCH domain-containing protein n=1 Tax=Streptomyces misionensis TaxID=67331 RepID=A0A5C6JZF7_9ACTN|nr:ASCH domain-containing protein [Streptomyces misionensis]TWV53463.1 ASCH domain-containing protein [Streptomyces misionensis]
MTVEPAQSTGPAFLPKAEFAFPGPLRDRLVAAILDGSKTATTALLARYEHEGEPLPSVGRRSVVVDSGDRPVAVIEVTEVRVVSLDEVDLTYALDEGEGYTTVRDWRAEHERERSCDVRRPALPGGLRVLSACA